ncbi:ribosome small subunit-dependent GTPase A [Saccharibacillus sp. CPCC 101409]|uniref:ribosome small subunit-dependent GTPase A n=1 Tax=Saccharibacillus sp. CPCC 101409 TaxID=3058041 RepID=UPI0026716AAB|nr:ribosome small subunit-dependent GTPase A [Saccharibacillus sp. CPCC 101409]MDO3409730.1 ribosome small subunit-dependent GTPase A [Saccharibacillus sp. CPCC 101409]
MTDLKTYGYIETKAVPEGLLPGRVTELRREIFTIATERGEVTAALKGTFYHRAETRADFPCVGDFVHLRYNEHGSSRIVEVLPRRSKFSRADYSGHAVGYAKTLLEQVVATNFDYVFILSSLNRDLSAARILRYVTQAERSGGRPVVLLSKADLVQDYSLPLGEVTQSIPGVPVHVISSHSGLGLSELSPYLAPGKTVVFLGMSGVGKSSLLNALMRQDVMKVQDIRENDSRGRHTTTHRQLFMLPSGAMVIDTPGMRELGLFDAEDSISASFADVEALFARCRFADCRHRTEPGCAVRAALADGSLPNERWERYLAQRQESEYVRNKTAAGPNKQAKKNGGKRK